MGIRNMVGFVRELIGEWSAHESQRTGAALAYFTALSLALLTVLFGLLFRFVPDLELRLRDVAVGAAVPRC